MTREQLLFSFSYFYFSNIKCPLPLTVPSLFTFLSLQMSWEICHHVIVAVDSLMVLRGLATRFSFLEPAVSASVFVDICGTVAASASQVKQEEE